MQITLEDGSVEKSVKDTVDDNNSPIEVHLPKCEKVFWQCRRKESKKTCFLCFNPLLKGGECNKLFVDYS